MRWPRTPIVTLALVAGVAGCAQERLIEVDAAGLMQRVKATNARLTIVNAWATWCEPCKEEFPDLIAVANGYADRGVRLMFVSTDFGDDIPKALAFIKAQGAPRPSFVMNDSDEAFIEALSPDWVGTLPATVIFDDQGRRVAFFQGKIAKKTLTLTLDRILQLEQGKK